ncbi:MAG: hypothetical protein JXQ76_06035 [Campylobacterales bacterium]|nr:hypothetical protein [Campylobacterales bacterium]
MKKILGLVAFIALSFTGAYAAGTAANTDVVNTATLTFTGGPAGGITASDTFKVDRKVDLTVTWDDLANIVVGQNDTDQVLTFTVSNTGNDLQDFALTEAIASGSTFSATNIRIYIDNGDNTYGAGDTLSSTINDLAADSSIKVFIVSDIPGTATNGQVSNHTLTATALTSAGGTLSETSGADTADAVDTVFVDTGYDATEAATGTYEVSTSNMSITKTSCVISDPRNGTNNPKRIPSAVVRYAIQVTNAGGSQADGVSVNDVLPAEVTFNSAPTRSPIVVTESCNCASPGLTSNGGSVTNASDTITINYGSVVATAGSNVECAYFEVTID